MAKYEKKQASKGKQLNKKIQENLFSHIKKVMLKGEKIDFIKAAKDEKN